MPRDSGHKRRRSVIAPGCEFSQGAGKALRQLQFFFAGQKSAQLQGLLPGAQYQSWRVPWAISFDYLHIGPGAFQGTAPAVRMLLMHNVNPVRVEADLFEHPGAFPSPDQNPSHQNQLDSGNGENWPVPIPGKYAREAQRNNSQAQKQGYQPIGIEREISASQDARGCSFRASFYNNHGPPRKANIRLKRRRQVRRPLQAANCIRPAHAWARRCPGIPVPQFGRSGTS